MAALIRPHGELGMDTLHKELKDRGLDKEAKEVARLAAEIEKAKRLALGDFVMGTKGRHPLKMLKERTKPRPVPSMPVPRRETIRDYKRWHPQAHEEVFPLEKKRTLKKSKGDSMRSQSTEPTMSMSLTRKDIEDMMPAPLAPLYVPGGVVGTNLVSRETAPSAEQVEKYKTALAMVNEELRLMDETEAQRAAEAFNGAQTLPSHRSRSQTGGRRSARPRATKFPSGFNVPTTMDFNPDERPILAQNLRKLTPGDYGDRPYPELIHRKGATSRIHPGGQFECASKSKSAPRNLREQGGAGILRFPTPNMAK